LIHQNTEEKDRDRKRKRSKERNGGRSFDLDEGTEDRVCEDADLVTSRDEFIGKGEVRLDVSSTSDCHDEDAMFPGGELGKGLKVEAEVFERCVETILDRSIGRKREEEGEKRMRTFFDALKVDVGAGRLVLKVSSDVIVLCRGYESVGAAHLVD